MKFNKYFKNFALFLFILFAAVFYSSAQAQNFPSPRENKLLNGTKLLVWNDKKADKVVVKLRVNSGSAFDPLGKEGVMQLLSDILFPPESTKEYFTEDLNGSFEIVTNYDYIQINASGDSDKFLAILEALAPAITNPKINKETTEKVRAALLARVQELEKNPSYIADQAAAKRLFGNFPYGRPQLGSSESLAKIDFADLLTADQKFFTADNATIAISGNVNADFALRATKRLFGGWLKSDRKVPATFAQPDAPTSNQVKVEMPNIEKRYTAIAIDTVGRGDKDFWATQTLSKIWKQKYCFNVENSRSGELKYEPHLLRGIYYIRKNESLTENLPVYSGPCAIFGLNVEGKTVFQPITQTDFDSVKQGILADFQQKTLAATSLVDLWLDAETYKLISVKDELQKLNSVSLADIQRVEEKLRKQPTVTVSLTKQAEQKQNN